VNDLNEVGAVDPPDPVRVRGVRLDGHDLARLADRGGTAGDQTAASDRDQERVEARLAYLKTALKITDAQQSQWDAFASVMRKTGKKLGKTLRGAAQATAKAAGKTAEVVAVRTRISAKQVRQKAEFLKMGESFYRARKSGMSPEQILASMQPQVTKLDTLQQEIATLELREKTLRN